MAMAATSQAAKRLGIVVGGGPAPGINGTISAVAIEAGTTKRGFQRGVNIPFGRERGSYPDREILG